MESGPIGQLKTMIPKRVWRYFKASLDRAGSNLVWGKMSLFTAGGGMRQSLGPFHPKPLWDSVTAWCLMFGMIFLKTGFKVQQEQPRVNKARLYVQINITR